MSMNKLYNSKKKMEEINNGTKKKIKLKPKRKNFEDKYKRLTTYLTPELYKKIHILKDSNKIRTITDFINSALQDYIENHF
ncbi:MAG: hypothetical protein ACOCRO_06450 [Halanaerobiales bacterium]